MPILRIPKPVVGFGIFEKDLGKGLELKITGK
jgi:hypothetical protein